MIVAAVPPRRPFRGSVAVPPSKSFTNRALILAALASRPVTIRRPLACDDADAMVSALSAAGVRIRTAPEALCVEPGDPPPTRVVLDVRDSGTACRFLTAFAAATPGLVATITGSGRLRERPVGPLVEALRSMGAEIDDGGRPGFPPLHIRGRSLSGGSLAIDASQSSQYASALLLIAPRLSDGLALSLSGPAVSRGYLATTREALASAGVSVSQIGDSWAIAPGAAVTAPEWTVPGDYSSAAALAAAVAVAGGSLRLEHLGWPSTQADARAFEVLSEMGVGVRPGGGGVIVDGRAAAPVSVDASDFPDAVPVLCAVAARVEGESVFSGIEHLRIKESDRVAAIEDILHAAGIAAEFGGGALRVFGSRAPNGRTATFPTRADHRIVMAATLLSLAEGGLVENPRAVEKSYPGFFRDLFGI